MTGYAAPRTSSRRRGHAITAGAAILWLVSVSIPVSAHANLRTSSPVDGQTIRKPITQIDLVFWAPISDPVIEVNDPGGFQVVGQTTQQGNTSARFEMPSLTTEGEYKVSYEVISLDDDLVVGSTVFFYAADDATGLERITLMAAAIVIIVGWGVLHSIRRSSARHTSVNGPRDARLP